MFMFPFEIGKRLLDFMLSCKTLKPSAVAEELVMLGVAPELRDDFDHSFFSETRSQWQLNKQVWRILNDSGMLPKVRRVLRADLQTTSDLEGCGKIALKSYTQDLLDNFLKSKPHHLWV